MSVKKMKTGKLTPKSNNVMAARRYSGSFGQPDGFGSVLAVTIHNDGEIQLTLTWKSESASAERQWSVRLTNEQRKNLGHFLSTEFEPVLWEDFNETD